MIVRIYTASYQYSARGTETQHAEQKKQAAADELAEKLQTETKIVVEKYGHGLRPPIIRYTATETFAMRESTLIHGTLTAMVTWREELEV